MGLIAAAVCLAALAAPQAGGNLLSDGGFESLAPGGTWNPYESGFVADPAERRQGRQSIRCANADDQAMRGAMAVLRLDQQVAAPVAVTGWSKCEGVAGSANGDYAVYIDVFYQDGTPLYGQIAPFRPDVSGWQKRQVVVHPTQPIKTLNVYALFRRRAGTAWFDDFEARQYPADRQFDSQLLPAPKLPAQVRSGWFLRDVAAGTDPFPSQAAADHGLRATVAADALTVESLTDRPRAVTAYFVERFESKGAAWWDDVRRSRPAASGAEFSNLARLANQGATSAISVYPFGCVTAPGRGLMLGVPALQGPSVYRIGYHANSKLLFVAFDLALLPTPKHRRAKVAVVRKAIDSNWGFRAAAAAYYAAHPDAYRRRAKAEGIWLAFTDPAKVPNIEDFGVAYHEGDNSVESDAKLGILSFRYTEPMTWWMPMPPELPRTRDAAEGLLQKHLAGSDPATRSWAQAVVHSASWGPDGKPNVEFQNQPWANGAVWVLNPNPAMPHPPGEATKATLSYSKAMGDVAYRRPQSGEYLDSIEGWADYLDYRPASLAGSSYPPTFSTDEHRPVVPTWFSVYELARSMRDDLRARGKLLFANATPYRISWFLPLLDVSGAETNWNQGSNWSPDSDAAMCLRRTLSGQKPYLLLQNTDFDKFDTGRLQKYLERSCFYGIYPSMFSPDAATRVFWDNPAWVEAARPFFKQTIPVIQALSKAGWEPVTYARTNHPRLYIERFGREFLTLLNDSAETIEGTIRVDAALAGKQGLGLTNFNDYKIGEVGPKGGSFRLRVEPERCIVIRLVPKP